MADELPQQDENQIIAERRAKLAELRAGSNAYPNDFARTDLAADLHSAHGAKANEDLEPAVIHAGVAAHDAFKRWDLGDIVGARGTLFKTRTGELSLRVTELRLLAKALRPLPEKFHGLADQESKYRPRHLDLIMNEDARRAFSLRGRIIQEIRAFMVERGFLEVETPMMHPIPGGAAARPFVP